MNLTFRVLNNHRILLVAAASQIDCDSDIGITQIMLYKSCLRLSFVCIASFFKSTYLDKFYQFPCRHGERPVCTVTRRNNTPQLHSLRAGSSGGSN